LHAKYFRAVGLWPAIARVTTQLVAGLSAQACAMRDALSAIRTVVDG